MYVYPHPSWEGGDFSDAPKTTSFNKKFPQKNCSIIKVETLPTLTFLSCVHLIL